MSLGIAAYSSRPDVVGFQTAQLQIESVWVSVREAKVRPAASCKRSSAKPVLGSPFAGDIVSPRNVRIVDLDVSQYCTFDVSLARSRLRADGVPAEVYGASILVVGRLSSGTRFIVRSQLEASPLLAATDLEGLTVKRPRTSWIVGVDVDRWFAGVDVAAASVGEKERTIRIEETSNSDLLEAFEANVPSGFALFTDTNDDGALDPAERSHPIASVR